VNILFLKKLQQTAKENYPKQWIEDGVFKDKQEGIVVGNLADEMYEVAVRPLDAGVEKAETFRVHSSNLIKVVIGLWG
jgi:hypothetical protein